jgi:transposase
VKIDLANLPQSPELMQRLLMDLLRVLDEKDRILAEKDQELGVLRHRLAGLRRSLYGRSSEKLDPEQLKLAFEELSRVVNADVAPEPPSDEPEEPPEAEELAPVRKKNGHGRKGLPDHLPRDTQVLEPPEKKVCDQCHGTEFVVIGEEVSEQLDYRPASFRVRRTVRKKFGCASCHGSVVTADLPSQVIERGIPTAGLLAHVLTSKFGDHLPLYRLEEIFEREGVEVSRKTMCGWVGYSADLLEPVYKAMTHEVVASKVIHTDDTPVKVLDPDSNKRRTKLGRIWVYVGDDLHPQVVFDYTASRERDGPEKFLEGFGGYLHVDAYAGYNGICGPKGAKRVACMAHVRRKFYDAQKTDLVRALTAMAFIKRLYEIEEKGKGMNADERRALRQTSAKPLLSSFQTWLQKEQVGVLPKSPMGIAIHYALGQMQGLRQYLDDGDLDIDNNEAERALRPIAIGRKNWLFFGSDDGGRRGAIISSLIATCKRHGVPPFLYLRDLLERISTHPASRVEELFPARWKALFGAEAAARDPLPPAPQPSVPEVAASA